MSNKYQYTIHIHFVDGEEISRKIVSPYHPGEIINYIRLLSEGENMGTGIIESVSIGQDFEVIEETDTDILNSWINDEQTRFAKIGDDSVPVEQLSTIPPKAP